MTNLDRKALALDAADGLGGLRSRFKLDPAEVYLDGNSLGPMLRSIPGRIAETVDEDWGAGLIRSWNDAGWIDLPRVTGASIAGLVGAEDDCVTVADSTSANLFKVLAAALSLNPERLEILTERGNFPTDLYIADGLTTLLDRGHRCVFANTDEEIYSTIGSNTAVVMLTHVDFRTGRMLDMEAITRRAHEKGALVIWDLAHSAGAVPLNLDRVNADFAVGCGYKYLNGGPGAPAFVYVNRRHLGKVCQPLAGWFSHCSPFAFKPEYQRSSGIEQFNCGTPNVLSMVALHEALSIWGETDIFAAREKSLALTDFFLECLKASGLLGVFELVTPTEHAQRGSQISLRFEGDGYAVMQALIARGVIGDFRAPDLLRFGFAPLYTSFEETLRSARTLALIMESGEWRNAQFAERKAVT